MWHSVFLGSDRVNIELPHHSEGEPNLHLKVKSLYKSTQSLTRSIHTTVQHCSKEVGCLRAGRYHSFAIWHSLEEFGLMVLGISEGKDCGNVATAVAVVGG